MILSRTARILLALLLMAAAAFVWVNFFAAGPAPIAPIVDVPPSQPATQATVPSVESDASVAAAPDRPASAETAQQGGAGGTTVDAVVPADAADTADTADTVDAAPTVAIDVAVTDAGPDAPGGAPSTTPTVVTGAAQVTVADVEVLALPFLVTEPPPPDELAIDGEPIDVGPRLAANAPAPVRSTVNPFSPIVLPAVAEVPEPETPEVVEVVVPVLPTAAEILASRSAVADLAPRAVTPRSPTVVSLPRSLPTGSVLAAPSILTSPRASGLSGATASAGATLQPGAGLAGLALPVARVPDLAAPASPVVLPRTSAASESAFVPDLLSTPRIGSADVGSGGEPANTGPGRSTDARNALEAYLLDEDVAFTGSVLGNVAVGVFRVGGYASPVVLSLGQTLLDTEIVLTDVGSQSAEFTLGELTHVMTLELGR